MISYNVINTVAGAGDVVVSDGKLTITGAPTMDYLKIGNSAEQASIYAVPYVATIVTSAAANSTTYSVSIQQAIPELPSGVLQKNIVYVSDATATTAEITNAFTALINASGFELDAVASAGTTVTLTARTGYELFTLTNTCTAANFAIASAMATQTVALALAADQITGTTTVLVEVDAGFPVVVGNLVTITGYSGPTLTGGLGNNVYRVATVPSAVTFTLDKTTSDGVANIADITVTLVATKPLNSYASLTALGIVGVTAGLTYTAFEIPYGAPSSATFGLQNTTDNLHTVYVNEVDSDYPAARLAIERALSGLNAGGTAANPEAISHLD